MIPPKILIVDDSASNLLALEEVLHPLNVEIVQALSGTEALDKTIQDKFALIISDVCMPGMDGYEMANLLHRNQDTKIIPIIFVSAINKADFQMIKGIDSGAVDFIVKPISPELLLGKVRVFLDLYNYQQSLVQAREEASFMEKKAMNALEAKSMFLSTMSHEIRTPMNAIIGFTELLMEDVESPDRMHYLEIIKGSGESLLSIINDILDISKFEAGKIELEELEFDIRNFMLETIQVHLLEANKRDVRIDFEVEENIKKYCVGDYHCLRQVLANLISNALKFTRSGKIWIKLYRAKCANLCFEVKDTGVGIDEANLEVIFESFTQAEMSTTRIYGGTGLGLSIVKNIVNLWGGSIDVFSKLGQGTSFQVYLPMEDVDSVSEVKLVRTREDTDDFYELNGIKVLCCEDQEFNVRLLEILLNKFDLSLDIVRDGSEGVKLFNSNSYDIILMDICMVGMNGLEACKEIQFIEKEQNLDHTPILAVSANVMHGDVEFYLSLGFDDHLPKPFSANDLYQMISKYLIK
ncbi:response regulator [bacterium]|nr:response regulator [bacterium]